MQNQVSSQDNIDALARLTVPNMGNIEINADTLAIARSYLDVIEKKFGEEKKRQISSLICQHCSQDEENNPTNDDIVLLEVSTDFEYEPDFKSWQCTKCQFKIFTSMAFDGHN